MRISDWSSDVFSSDLRAFIVERVHPAISGTENRDRFASLYRQRTRAKRWQLVTRANIKPFCGHGSTSSNDRERSDFCDVLVQVPLGARCTPGPRVLLQDALGMKAERSEERRVEKGGVRRSRSRGAT